MNILVIAPTHKEPEEILSSFKSSIAEVSKELKEQGHALTYYFLSDGQTFSLEPLLINHTKALGLAHTLIEGYAKALAIPFDVLVRMDTNEDDPRIITNILPKLLNADVIACPRIAAPDYSKGTFNRFTEAINEWNEADVIDLYNRVFPCGCIAFTRFALETITPLLQKGVEEFETMFGEIATWGVDLLTLLLASRSMKLDFNLQNEKQSIWIANHTNQKDDEQRSRAQKMFLIAKILSEKGLLPNRLKNV